MSLTAHRCVTTMMGAGLVVLGLASIHSGCVGYLDVDAGRVDASTSDGAAADVSNGEASADGAAGDASDGAACTAYECAVLADKPVLYLRLEETSATGKAKDSSGAGRDGDLALPITAGVEGAMPGSKAMTFGGNGSEILMPPGLDFNGDAVAFTVEAWVKPTNVDGLQFIIDHETHDGPRGGWLVGLDTGGELVIELWKDNASLAVGRATGAVTMNVWSHLVVSYDQKGHRLYGWVNASMVMNTTLGDGVTPLPSLITIGEWRIGRQNCTPGCLDPSFIGTLDELAVYDKIVDDAWVLAHYQKSGR